MQSAPTWLNNPKPPLHLAIRFRLNPISQSLQFPVSMNKLFTFLFLCIPLFLKAQDPTFDPSFGHMGKVLEDYSTGEVEVVNTTLQKDGKWLVIIKTDPIIWVQTVNNLGKRSEKKHYALLRLDEKGKCDSTFGIFGKYEIEQRPFPYELSQIVADSLDKIYLSGRFLTSPPNQFSEEWDNFVMRLEKDGKLDNSFGQKGFLHLRQQGIPDFTVDKLLPIPPNKLVIGGSMTTNANYYLTKFSHTGQVDSSFGNNGLVIHGIPAGLSKNSFITNIKIQQDSMLLVCGMEGLEGLITRFFPDGKVDSILFIL